MNLVNKILSKDSDSDNASDDDTSGDLTKQETMAYLILTHDDRRGIYHDKTDRLSNPGKKPPSAPMWSKMGYWPVAPGWISAFRCTKPHVLTPTSQCAGSV